MHDRNGGATVTTTVLSLVACAIVIYLSCEYFVNGVEWLGLRLGLARSAVGTVLAAFGTALPESVVTFVAVVTGKSPAEHAIGVGAALGGPLVLATVAYGAVGTTWLACGGERRSAWLSRQMQTRLAQDQGWFLAVFAAKVILGLFVFAFKPWFGVLFLLAYALYTWREISAQASPADLDVELERLRFRPNDESPTLSWIALQTMVALVVTFVASELFVRALEQASPMLGLSPQMTALLLSPIATELPETLNAVIWLRQGKSGLALGNISGAMMIQATVPSALGIFFTPWLFDPPLILACAITAGSIALMWWYLRRAALSAAGLAAFALLYVLFAALLWLPACR